MTFAGFPVGSIENKYLRIDYLLRGSLRLARLMFGENDRNLFIELPGAGWNTPNGYYRILGGHRLWIAPEIVEITYLPEPEEIIEEKIPGGIRLTQPTDPRSGVQKSLEVSLETQKASFTVKHILFNKGEKEIMAAAWAITQFRPGGIAAIPQPQDRTDANGLLPNRSMALWPYTRLNDPRLRWMKNYLMVRTQPIEQPCKVGFNSSEGWVAYLLDGVLIRKQVELQPGAQYPDMNSALEVYTNDKFIELESLSPLVHFQPGDRIVHEEQWDLESAYGLDSEEALAEYLDK